MPGVLPVSACQWPWDQSSTPSSSCLSLLCFPPPYPQTRTGSPIHRSRGISELVKHGWREWGERKERGAAVAGRGASGRTTERSRFRDGFLRVTFWGGRDLFFLLRGHARPFSFIFSSEVTPVPFLLSFPRSRPSLFFFLLRGHARPLGHGPHAVSRVSQCHCMPKYRSAVVAARNDLTLTANPKCHPLCES